MQSRHLTDTKVVDISSVSNPLDSCDHAVLHHHTINNHLSASIPNSTITPITALSTGASAITQQPTNPHIPPILSNPATTIVTPSPSTTIQTNTAVLPTNSSFVPNSTHSIPVPKNIPPPSTTIIPITSSSLALVKVPNSVPSTHLRSTDPSTNTNNQVSTLS